MGIIVIIIYAFLQILIGLEVSKMMDYALTYSAKRGEVLVAGFVVLLCIIGKFVIDRILIKNRPKEVFSPLILDVVFFVMTVLLSIALFGPSAKNAGSISVLTVMIYVILTTLYDRDYYFGKMELEVETEEDPYAELDEESDAETDAETDVETEGEVTASEESDGKSESKNARVEKEDKQDKPSEEIESDENEDVEDLEDEIEGEEEDSMAIIRLVFAEMLRVLMFVASAAFGVWLFLNTYLLKTDAMFYLLLVLFAILTLVLRFVLRAMDKIIERAGEESKTVRLIGYIITVISFAIFLCFQSLLVGLLYILGAFLTTVIIPMALDNWGRGGTKVVLQNKYVLGKLAYRIISLIIILIAVWMLSYGALWEVEFMLILGMTITSNELIKPMDAL